MLNARFFNSLHQKSDMCRFFFEAMRLSCQTGNMCNTSKQKNRLDSLQLFKDCTKYGLLLTSFGSTVFTNAGGLGNVL